MSPWPWREGNHFLKRVSPWPCWGFSAFPDWFSISLSSVFGVLSCEEDLSLKNRKRGFKNLAAAIVSSSAGNPCFEFSLLVSGSLKEQWTLHPPAFHTKPSKILQWISCFYCLNSHCLLPGQETWDVLQGSQPGSVEPATRHWFSPSLRKADLLSAVLCVDWH